jgi:uncharacterized protein (TIGR02444 family)
LSSEDRPNDPAASGELARFAVDLYSRPGVSEACLLLQDRCGVNIPVLLTAAWLGRRGATVTRTVVREADAAVRDWQDEIVGPLRAVRRRLRLGPRPAPQERTERLREMVKRAELSAEFIELSALEDFAVAIPVHGERPDAAGLLSTVVAFYSDGPIQGDHSEAIEIIAAAMSRD